MNEKQITDNFNLASNDWQKQTFCLVKDGSKKNVNKLLIKITK